MRMVTIAINEMPKECLEKQLEKIEIRTIRKMSSTEIVLLEKIPYQLLDL